MKKLQNNFTTIEQSKRLLELGVSADSADLFYHKGGKWISIFQMEDKTSDFPARFERTPCWSVGRLIEIYEIVGESAGQCITTTKGTSRIESLVQLYEENTTLLDFSKLEE
jgi:hypothetical protein